MEEKGINEKMQEILTDSVIDANYHIALIHDQQIKRFLTRVMVAAGFHVEKMGHSIYASGSGKVIIQSTVASKSLKKQKITGLPTFDEVQVSDPLMNLINGLNDILFDEEHPFKMKKTGNKISIKWSTSTILKVMAGLDLDDESFSYDVSFDKKKKAKSRVIFKVAFYDNFDEDPEENDLSEYAE